MTSLEFAEAARQIGSVIRGVGHVVPTFRSPPKVSGRARSILRRPDGSVTVAVALRRRAMNAVVADMIEGVVVANQLHGHDAAWLRDILWNSVEGMLAPDVSQPMALISQRVVLAERAKAA